MAWFLNHYRCDACGQRWTDTWSVTCNDRCPACGLGDIEPCKSVDLSEIVVGGDGDGTFLVMKSSDTAEHKPDYRILVEFPTRAEAEGFLREGNATR